MGTKHKHAEVIKAWADGGDIQVRSPHSMSAWVDSNQPAFAETFEYRVKPKELVVEKAQVVYSSVWGLVTYAKRVHSNVAFTFDPDTMKLIKVELIND